MTSKTCTASIGIGEGGTDDTGARTEEEEGREATKVFLASMGFEEALIQRAVARFPNDRSRAVDWLLSGSISDDDAVAQTQADAEAAETDVSGFGADIDAFGDGSTSTDPIMLERRAR